MQIELLRAFFVQLGLQDEQGQEHLPTYSPLATSPTSLVYDSENAESAGEGSGLDDHQNDCHLSPTSSRLPQFLAHFTLGFADGLTVPFALTAGLSSLGETRTVIYAGTAEICAGCISMGISGYLAVKGEREIAAGPGTGDCEKREKRETVEQDYIQKYLSPLELPPDLYQSIIAHIDNHPIAAQRLLSISDRSINGENGFPAAVVGLFISFGYLVGGLLPLCPYFFVDQIDSALRWSFVVCIVSLFIFGFAKDYLLRYRFVEDGCSQDGNTRTETATRDKIKGGCWEGMRMVIMGGIAAVAAVLCVRLFEEVV
ncbi:DUF125-domain-containing protein [Hypoxylon fragiforme]|uniref:DUF125-domain-containing protein n=1 Tax=Hypoxylon fragiforme TaxID=63214 RepID=UPI0020C6D6CC|nr:DUF125-domain-containing protein [Hypoxylon fragiforme]KAI2612697.1 DUF125-domain-containing protein [Hypoxylon fragiforme]